MELIVKNLENNTEKIYQYHEIESLSGDEFSKKTRDIVFVTGNQNKVIELGDKIKTKSINFTTLDLDLPEIQDSKSLNIVEDKCKQAFQRVNQNQPLDSQKSILIEDTSLSFAALNGMPGPYIKWFLKAVGPLGLHKMLVGFEDKSAEATCIYALMDDPSRIIFCKGTVRGRIVQPRGSSWGWDPVFEEERSRLTFAEMDLEMKSKFSHRANAITLLKKYLTSGESCK